MDLTTDRGMSANDLEQFRSGVSMARNSVLSLFEPVGRCVSTNGGSGEINGLPERLICAINALACFPFNGVPTVVYVGCRQQVCVGKPIA